MDLYQTINTYRGLPFQMIVYNENTDDSLHFFPSHWHHYLEISATVSGRGKAVIDGNEYRIMNHNVFIISPDCIHRIEGFFPYSENRGYCLQIDLSAFSSVLPIVADTYYPTCSEKVSDMIIDQLVLLEKEIEEKKNEFDLVSRIIQILKILNVYQKCNDSQINDENKKLVLRIADYIELHYMEEINVNTLSFEFGYSTSYLQKIFRKNFYQSVHKYISERRFVHALDDLKYTDLTVMDIALKNGFSGSRSFIREFKKIAFTTPGEYRKKIENDHDQ